MGLRVVVRQVAAMAAKAYLMTFGSLVFWALLPLALGWTPTVVMSGSMEPNVMVGDVLVAQHLSREEVLKLKPGFVLYAIDPVHPERMITHRVVNTLAGGGGFITKGDANAAADTAPMPVANVLGMERIRIPYIGIPLQAIRTGNPFPALLFAASIMLSQIIIMFNRSRNKAEDKAQSEKEDDDESPLSPPNRLRPRRRSLPRSKRTRVLATHIAAAGATVASAMVIAVSTAAFSSVVAPPQSSFSAQASFPCLSALPPDNPYLFYRFNEVSGSVATDVSGNGWNGTLQGTTTRVPGSCSANASPALILDGSSGYVSSPTPATAPDTFTAEIWFRTSTSSGGKLIGLGDAQTGPSGTSDRHIYMTNTGAIAFGAAPAPGNGSNFTAATIISSPGFNNGLWHQASASMSVGGIKLYVDGTLVASDSSVTKGAAYTGYWRMGYDTMNVSRGSWANAPSSLFFPGAIDNAAVYSTALSATQIAAHYAAGR